MVDQDGGVKLFDYDEVLAHVTDLANQNESGKIWVRIKSTVYEINIISYVVL